MAEHTSPSSPAASATPPAAAASPAASATPPPAANTALHENPTELEENKKRKPTKKSEFQVVRVIESYRTGRYSLKMVKPFSSKIDVNTCPTVCLKEARADDKHAFHIMHGFHHKNILHMKLLAKNVMQNNDPLAAATFVEPYDGKLLSICGISECADEINHIPSPKFQRYVREIVIGIDFLMKNNLYHGNLSWDSTLHSNETVKLAGFKLKELMSDQEAKWNDWLCFTKMLEVISERTHVWNQNVQSNPSLSQSQRVTFFCGILDSLIVMLKGLDCTSLLHMKDIILEDPFFWDFSKRVNFFANTVSLRLSDTNFMNIVRNSAICEKHWETNCASEFKDLVTEIAEYQEDVRMKAEINRQRGAWRGGHHRQSGGRRGGRVRQLGGRRRGNDSKGEQPSDGDFKEHYLRCVCGGYTHHRPMKVNVDWAVRINHPTICIDMKKILDTADGLDLEEIKEAGYRCRLRF